MKKTILTYVFIICVLLSGFSQNTLLTLSGHVMDVTLGMPIANQTVTAEIMSGGMVMAFDYTTDNTGFYGDSIPVFSQGVIQVSTYDCLGELHLFSEPFNPGNYNFSVDFYICADSVPNGCSAYFTYTQPPIGGNTVFFADMSSGNPTGWFWDFGDGNSSSQQNPVHEYSDQGIYPVCLSIFSIDSTCFDVYCEDVIVGNPGGDCQNFFYYETWNFIDYAFMGESLPFPADLYLWDFGDGSTGEGQTVTHAYGPNTMDSVWVTLTTYAFDAATGDSCVAFSGQVVWVGNPGGDCNNWFSANTSDQFTFDFTGEGLPPADSYFWEFGDGFSGTGQFIEHTYDESFAGQQVLVTLTTLHIIPGSVDSCIATSVQPLTIGEFIPDCENFYWYVPLTNYGYTFFGESIPIPADEYFWDFGDGTTGTGQQIDHTFDPASGDVFMVSLTTFSYNPNNDSCVAESIQEVWINNSGSDCENLFDFESVNNIDYTFFGEAFPMPAEEFFWNFGDGTTANGQVVTHTFNPALGNVFNVCLTTYSYSPIGDSCMAESCQEIYIGGQSGVEIFGTVIAENAPVDFALVGLFGMDSIGGFSYEFTTTESGSYLFENVPEGNYYLFASLTPQSSLFYDYFPTYYSNAIFWFDADLISLGEPENPYQIDLIPITSYTSGPGIISGNVIMENGNKTPGENILIMLMDENNNPIRFVQTNENGDFSFSDLALGTYHLTVEMPGINSEIAVVLLNEDLNTFTLQFFVNNTSAYLNIHNNLFALSSIGDIYPNPVSSKANLEVEIMENTNILLQVINQTGSIVLNKTLILDIGRQTIELNTKDFSPGLYYVQLIGPDGNTVSRKFIK